MKRCHSMRLLSTCSVAFSVAASFGTAHAGPEDCLTLRDNIAVAGCADKFAPGPSPAAAPSARQTTREMHQPIEAAEKWLLFPVPSATVKVAPKREAPEVIAARDRSELIRRSEMGAVGLAGLGLVFGVWRWRSSMIKTCSYCGTRAVSGSAVCKRCFRSV